ncbi:unnamed protein product [Allacma fusca]|uniref:Uncharacterized protein n=1 Tax=Allacma fusca TaxID=39272 RepID=A0A8J2JA77_9HEXA|nr:unnamed protein product [Allacma fusca]
MSIPDLISPEFENDILHLSKLLTPFLDLTNELQAEGVTSSRVILGIITLYKQVAAVVAEEGSYIRALRTSLCLTIYERFGSDQQLNYAGKGAKKCLRKVFDNDAYILATILDPRWKMTPFQIELPETYKLNQCMPKIEKIKNVLTKAFEKEKELAAEVIEIQQGELEAVNVPSASKRTKVDFLASFIPEDGETTLPGLKNEVDEYLKSPGCLSNQIHWNFGNNVWSRKNILFFAEWRRNTLDIRRRLPQSKEKYSALPDH